jgi:putative membrane protein insertion efficiency factor
MTPWRPGPIDRALAIPCIWLILAYRVTLSPFLGRQCRFHPTCSLYALDAYRRFGARWGTWLTARRLLRCHPFGGRGYDPVPVDRPFMKTGSASGSYTRLPTTRSMDEPPEGAR